MSQTPPSRAWTIAERESIKQVLLYAVSIFAAIAITLLIVALVSSVLTPAEGADTTTNIQSESTPFVTEMPK